MNKRIIIILLFLTTFLFTNFKLKAEEIINLDLDKAISYALKNNLTLKNNKLDFANSTLSMATSWNIFLPSANFSTSIGKSISQTDKSSMNLGFSTSLNVDGKDILNVYQSVLDYQSGKITLEQAEKKLSYDVKKYYYNVLLLKEELELKQKKIDASKSNYEISIIKFEKGMIAETDKLKSEYTYKSLIPDYASSYNDYISALISLKYLTGLDDNTEIELTDEIPEITGIDYEKIAELPIAANLDIKALETTLKSAKNSRNLYIASMFPAFGLSYSYSLGSENFSDPNWYNYWDSSGNLSFSLSLSLDSFIPYSSTQTSIAKLQNNVLQYKNDIKNRLNETRVSVTNDILKLKQLEEYFDSLKINIELAEKTYEVTKKSYIAGVKSYLDLVDSQNDLYDSKLELLAAKYNYAIYFIDLKYILNVDNI